MDGNYDGKVNRKEPRKFKNQCQINTEKLAMKEILHLCAEIMKKRKQTNPEDIFIPVEPYKATLKIKSELFYGVIKHDTHYGCGEICDYSFMIDFIEPMDGIRTVSFLTYSKNGEVDACAKDSDEEEVEFTADCLIEIHKGIVNLAKAEGIQFLSEVDYQKLK